MLEAIATSDDMLQSVLDELRSELNFDVANLDVFRESVEAVAPSNSPLLELRASASTPDNEAPRIDAPIVFTQLPPRTDFEKQPGAGGGTLRRDYGQGGRIVRLGPNGQVRVLTGGFDSACGADVSFDGERILFAGRKNPTLAV